MTPTAEEFLNGYVDDFYEISTENIPNVMIEFAKFHVTEALKKASEKAEIENDWDNQKGNISINSILTAYSLDSIV